MVVLFRLQNPYWINYRNLRENDKDRYMLSAALSYDILSWLNVAGRVRLDNSYNTYTQKYYASTIETIAEGKNGFYGVTNTRDKQTYADLLLNINKTFGEDWSLTANIGASYSDNRSEALGVSGPIAANGLPNFSLLPNWIRIQVNVRKPVIVNRLNLYLHQRKLAIRVLII